MHLQFGPPVPLLEAGVSPLEQAAKRKTKDKKENFFIRKPWIKVFLRRLGKNGKNSKTYSYQSP